ncbi:hypothetical protein [Sphingomonas sp. ID0503]
MTQLPDDDAVRRRQRSRAIVMALALGALVVLIYAIGMAKMVRG